MMKAERTLGLFAATLAGLALVGGCNSGSSGPNTSTSLDASQAAIVAGTAAGQVGSLASGLTNFGISSGFSGGFFAPATLGNQVLDIMAREASPDLKLGMAALSRAGCNPTVSDPTDTDGDGIPDNATFTFTAGNCSDTDPNTGATTTVTGSIHIQDTDNATTIWGFALTASSFTISITAPTQQGTQTAAVSMNGTYSADVQSGQASSTQALRLAAALNGTQVFGSSWTWSIAFTPTSGTLDPASQFPAGAFTFSGAYAWAGNYAGANGNWVFSMSTVSPLQYDGSCSDATWPFAAGSVQGAITARSSVGFTVDFQGCGQQPVVGVF
ncbi:MAG TPA: hypothetical protein VNH46_11365 [Gemmatimonadales bacterium]|nr:hypothetical protein [Gemmatimonadales bacterium]